QLADLGRFLRHNLSAPWSGPLAWAPVLLVVVGWVVAFATSARRSLGLLVLALCAGLGAVISFNRPVTYFRTLDRHYPATLVLIELARAIGAVAVLRAARRLRGMAGGGLTMALGALLLVVPSAAWRSGRRTCDLSRVRYAETFGRGLLEPLPERAILLTN